MVGDVHPAEIGQDVIPERAGLFRQTRIVLPLFHHRPSRLVRRPRGIVAQQQHLGLVCAFGESGVGRRVPGEIHDETSVGFGRLTMLGMQNVTKPDADPHRVALKIRMFGHPIPPRAGVGQFFRNRFQLLEQKRLDRSPNASVRRNVERTQTGQLFGTGNFDELDDGVVAGEPVPGFVGRDLQEQILHLGSRESAFPLQTFRIARKRRRASVHVQKDSAQCRNDFTPRDGFRFGEGGCRQGKQDECDRKKKWELRFHRGIF